MPHEGVVARGWRVQAFMACQAVSKQLGKSVCVSQDRPGFIVNRILMPMINEVLAPPKI